MIWGLLCLEGRFEKRWVYRPEEGALLPLAPVLAGLGRAPRVPLDVEPPGYSALRGQMAPL